MVTLITRGGSVTLAAGTYQPHLISLSERRSEMERSEEKIEVIPLHSTIVDDCEFTIDSVQSSTRGHYYEVCCWKKSSSEDKEYTLNHWGLTFKNKDKAVAEYNRWAGPGAYVG
jgi:hypothetical protein